MNILIVDDEILTLEGIIDSFDWKEIGLDCVLLADDGLKGIKIATEIIPDIVLTDVRMPCMDGIEMAIQLKEINPDTKVIFMSGYSDKEYLLSAIRMKAFSYIEKPVQRHELRKVLEEAVLSCKEEKQKRETEHINQKKLEYTVPFIKNQMAIQLLDAKDLKGVIREYTDLNLFNMEPLYI